MGWKFWKPQKSDAERSLEQLQAGATTVVNQAPASSAAGPADPADGEPTELGSDFKLTVEDVFSITGRGTVVTGRVEAGTITTGATLTITGANGSRFATLKGIETFRKVVYRASTGDNVGLLLSKVAKDEVARGDVITG